MTDMTNMCKTRDPLADARATAAAARRSSDRVRTAIQGLELLGMGSVADALRRAVDPFTEQAVDTAREYESAVAHLYDRIDGLMDRAAEHRAIVAERDELLAAAVRDADQRARRSGRSLHTYPAWVACAVDLLPLMSIDDDGRLIEEPF